MGIRVHQSNIYLGRSNTSDVSGEFAVIYPDVPAEWSEFLPLQQDSVEEA